MGDNLQASPVAIRIERDVPYGEGSIGFGTTTPGARVLCLDAYLPAGDAPPGGRPALVLSHGGAFHRGAKDRDEFEQEGSHNTPVHEYAERFAARGYACFSVGYRLTQEQPAPLPHPVKRVRHAVERERIDYVRGLLGLPPASTEELLRGSEAALADVAAAFAFIHAHAARWGIDRYRMAIGGFSAGAFASAYAVFALGQPAAAVVCLSGGMDVADADHYVHGARGLPPLLLFSGEHDLPSIPPRVTALATCAANAGLGVRHYQVPGKPHFYDRASAVVLQSSTLPGGEACATVEDAMQQFLATALAPPAVTVADLEAPAAGPAAFRLSAAAALSPPGRRSAASPGPSGTASPTWPRRLLCSRWRSG
jgi:acetyl esterase/lipase